MITGSHTEASLPDSLIRKHYMLLGNTQQLVSEALITHGKQVEGLIWIAWSYHMMQVINYLLIPRWFGDWPKLLVWPARKWNKCPRLRSVTSTVSSCLSSVWKKKNSWQSVQFYCTCQSVFTDIAIPFSAISLLTSWIWGHCHPTRQPPARIRPLVILLA